MSIFQRIVLLLKVLVMLSFGTSAAWAECQDHDEQASNGQGTHSELMIATSASDDDDSTADDPDTDEDDEDTQT